MPEITAIRGLRYNLGHVGSLAEVVAPPAASINEPLQQTLYKRHPANIVRLTLNRPEPGDQPSSRASRASRFIKRWQEEGVFLREPDPAIYVYHQESVFDGGETVNRKGFFAGVRLSGVEDSNLLPVHENDPSLLEVRRTSIAGQRANVEPFVGAYADETGEAQALLESAIRDGEGVELEDEFGIVHRLWPVTDAKILSEVNRIVCESAMLVVSGRESLDAAIEHRDSVAAAEGPLSSNHLANFGLAMLFPMNGPGMQIAPQHQVFPELKDLTTDDLTSRLSDCFTCNIVDDIAYDPLSDSDQRSDFLLYAPADGSWLHCVPRETAARAMETQFPDQSDSWRGAGVNVFEFVAKPLLTSGPMVAEILRPMSMSDAANLAQEKPSVYCITAPLSPEDIELFAFDGDLLKPGSAQLWHPPLSGLVLNPLFA